MTNDADRQIAETASEWFIEFRSGAPNANAREEFMRWLRRSPDHIRAYLEISQHYVRMPGAGQVSLQQADRMLENARARIDVGVVSIKRGRTLSGIEAPLPESVRRSRLFAIAASSLILCGLSALYLYSQRGVYVTSTGEERTVTLQDATRIELNSRTRLKVSYSKGLRQIDLFDGQALFQVTKDPSRPFVVRTHSAQIRAVGTEFDVYQHGEETRVTVLEGTVALQPVLADVKYISPSDLLVSAGEQAVMPSNGRPKARPTNAAAATAWTRGELEFIETPLNEVVEEFNRYSARRLVLSSQALASLRISGVYSSADPSSLVLFLRSQPDLAVEERGSEIRILPKKE